MINIQLTLYVVLRDERRMIFWIFTLGRKKYIIPPRVFPPIIIFWLLINWPIPKLIISSQDEWLVIGNIGMYLRKQRDLHLLINTYLNRSSSLYVCEHWHSNISGTFILLFHLLTCHTTILPFPTCSHKDVRIARLLTVHIRSPRCLSIH